jgi:hypothetical protein
MAVEEYQRKYGTEESARIFKTMPDDTMRTIVEKLEPDAARNFMRVLPRTLTRELRGDPVLHARILINSNPTGALLSAIKRKKTYPDAFWHALLVQNLTSMTDVNAVVDGLKVDPDHECIFFWQMIEYTTLDKVIDYACKQDWFDIGQFSQSTSSKVLGWAVERDNKNLFDAVIDTEGVKPCKIGLEYALSIAMKLGRGAYVGQLYARIAPADERIVKRALCQIVAKPNIELIQYLIRHHPAMFTQSIVSEMLSTAILTRQAQIKDLLVTDEVTRGNVRVDHAV